MISPLPGVTTLKPGSVTKPFFGIRPKVLHDDGEECVHDQGGHLVIAQVRCCHTQHIHPIHPIHHIHHIHHIRRFVCGGRNTLLDITRSPYASRHRRYVVYCRVPQSWPGMMRTVYGDHKRFMDTYFSQFPGHYCTGDGARVDNEGDVWILGRTDDVINVSGHRLGTAEVRD